MLFEMMPAPHSHVSNHDALTHFRTQSTGDSRLNQPLDRLTDQNLSLPAMPVTRSAARRQHQEKGAGGEAQQPPQPREEPQPQPSPGQSSLYERAKQQRARQAQRVAEVTAKECTFK